MYYAIFKNEKLNDIIKMIDEKDIYDDDKNDFGYETESHITLLYGIHPKEINKEEIFEYLKSIKSLELEIDNVSIFENDKFDVVKFDIKPTKELLKIRKYLIENIKNTQSFDGYHPHMTIAYVKKGEGEKYIKNLKEKIKIKLDKVCYSNPKYKKEFFDLEDK